VVQVSYDSGNIGKRSEDCYEVVRSGRRSDSYTEIV
jgi:hypothetical protein